MSDDAVSGSFRRIDGAHLDFLDEGSGDPVVLVHGSLTDARYWLRSDQLTGMARTYRVIAPSRRHNYPNPPSDDGGDYSAIDELLISLL